MRLRSSDPHKTKVPNSYLTSVHLLIIIIIIIMRNSDRSFENCLYKIGMSGFNLKELN